MAGILSWLSADDEEFDEEVEETERPKSSIYEQPLSKDTSNVVKKLNSVESNLQIYEPRGFKDSRAIGVSLLNGKGAVVNLHRLTKEQSIRVYDFLCGVIYAIDGDLKRLGKDTFIFTPKNIGLDGNITFDTEDEM